MLEATVIACFLLTPVVSHWFVHVLVHYPPRVAQRMDSYTIPADLVCQKRRVARIETSICGGGDHVADVAGRKHVHERRQGRREAVEVWSSHGSALNDPGTAKCCYAGKACIFCAGPAIDFEMHT